MKTKKNKTTISISLTEDIKNLLEKFSKKKDVSIDNLVEKAVCEYIEDEMDKAIITARKHEEHIEWKNKKRA